MPRKKLVINEEHVMSLTVAGLKKLCSKYKISKKGKKAELQNAVLKHLNIGMFAPKAEKKQGGATSQDKPKNNEADEKGGVLEPETQAAVAVVSEQEPERQIEPQTKADAAVVRSVSTEKQPTVTDLKQNQEHVPEIPEKKYEWPAEIEVLQVRAQPTLKQAEQVHELPVDVELKKENRTIVKEQEDTSKDKRPDDSKESLLDEKVDVLHDRKSNQKRSPEEAGVSGQGSATKKVKIDDSIAKSGVVHPNPEKSVDTCMGRTKREIEEFLKKQDPKELRKLCIELSKEAPELLKVLKQEAIKANQTTNVARRRGLPQGRKMKIQKRKHIKLKGRMDMSSREEAASALNVTDLDGNTAHCSLSATRLN